MSILPAEFNNKATVRWRDLALLDLPVPDSFADRQEQHEWSNYVQAIPLAKRLEKFGNVIDSIIALATQTSFNVADNEQVKVKFDAGYMITNAFQTVFRTETPKFTAESFDTDFGFGMHCITEFMKEINSPEAAVWNKRQNEFRAAMPQLNQRQTRIYNETHPTPKP